MEVPQTPKREEIERLHDLRDFDGIGRLEGFIVFEARDWEEDTRNRFGCLTWIFSGNRAKVSEFTSNPSYPPGYEETDNPQEGDIVTYFYIRQRNEMKIYNPVQATHSGIYIGKGRVRSKFRESHVYEHDLADVLSGYGTKVKFFRKK